VGFLVVLPDVRLSFPLETSRNSSEIYPTSRPITSFRTKISDYRRRDGLRVRDGHKLSVPSLLFQVYIDPGSDRVLA